MGDLFIENFRGIRNLTPVADVVSSGTISAVTCQNVELRNTENSANIAIFTAKGNKKVKDVGKKVIGQFESVQGGVSYWFIYAIDDTKGYLYSYDTVQDSLNLLNVDLSASKVCNGITLAQGYYDWFVFTNGIDDYVGVCMDQ